MTDYFELRPELKTFAEVMEIYLRLNDPNGGWKDESLEYLFNRLEDEVSEMRTALSNPDFPEGIQTECVDIANFAMMIFDVLSIRRDQP